MKPITFLLLLITSVASAQYPPAQGPGPISGTTNVREVPVEIFTSFLNRFFSESLIPKIDSAIDASDPPVDVDISYSLKQGKPYMSQTKYENQPNQNIIVIPYRVTYFLDLNNIPDRKMYQNLELQLSCPEWYAPGGGIMYVTSAPERPYLDGPAFSEQAINFFIGNWLTPLIDSRIRAGIPTMVQTRSPLAALDNTCNCMSVQPGTAPAYADGFIQYQNRAPRANIVATSDVSAVNRITVKLNNVRRLNAKNFEANQILYDEVENIQLEFWVNQQLQSFQLDNMKEGDVREIDENALSIPKPGANSSGMLVLIANITQPNFHNDTRFVVYDAQQNFGNGTKKLIVRKSYFSRPRRLPGGGFTKPVEMFVDAYELTVSIAAADMITR